MKKSYGCEDEFIRHYNCLRTKGTPLIDGNLEKSCWQHANKSARFVDLVTGKPGLFDTRMAGLWDDHHLYIGFWVEEPRVQAKFTERDSPVYYENDVEVFIAGPDCYYEFQINALGTIYEVFYIWQDAHKKGSYFDRPEFDLRTHNVDVLGGFQDLSRHNKHPRGKRWAFLDWDFPGLQAAVNIHGTLNDNSDIDKGWTVELALPWKGMEILAQGRSLPPQEGETWRMDFSRFEAFHPDGTAATPSFGWALNKHGVYDSHIPECFSFIHF